MTLCMFLPSRTTTESGVYCSEIKKVPLKLVFQPNFILSVSRESYTILLEIFEF